MKGKISRIQLYFIAFIILNILDFLKVLPVELDYFKKVLSWTMLGLIAYQVSLTHVFFGESHRRLDLVLMLAFLSLSVKNLLLYANITLGQPSSFFGPFFALLDTYSFVIGKFMIIFGSTLLVLVAWHTALVLWYHPRSVMGVLHEAGKPEKKHFTARFVITVLVFFSFYLFVFSLMMEWLAIAVDATILLVALLLYTVLLAEHKTRKNSILQKIANVGSDFYYSFIDHFRYRESFILGICGLLVLHILTDVGIFLFPYITTLKDPLYFSLLEGNHEVVWVVLQQSLSGNALHSAATILAFAGNLVGYVFLFLSPAIIWYRLYRKRAAVLSRPWLVVFYTALPAAVLSPLFLITRLKTQGLAGVDVLTIPLQHPYLASIFMAAFFVLSLSLVHHRSRRFLEHGWVASTLVFFGLYIWNFFISTLSHYLGDIAWLFSHAQWFMGGVFCLFMFLTALFYIMGFLLFVVEIARYHKS